ELAYTLKRKDIICDDKLHYHEYELVKVEGGGSVDTGYIIRIFKHLKRQGLEKLLEYVENDYSTINQCDIVNKLISVVEDGNEDIVDNIKSRVIELIKEVTYIISRDKDINMINAYAEDLDTL